MPPNRRPRRNGFSLVELLVVLFVLALLSGLAVIAIPDGGSDLRRESERFAAQVVSARDNAIVSSSAMAIVAGPAGYYVERRRDGAWVTSDGSTEPIEWSRGTVVDVGREGANLRIVFDPIGLASQDARIRLSRGGHESVVSVARDGSVKVAGDP